MAAELFAALEAEELFAALEATAIAQGLRNSVWAYPLVNAAHIFGVALAVGSIVPLDLKLLGLWPSVPLRSLWRVLTRTASAGIAIAATFGVLLFITRASEYAASSLFLAKMAVVALGIANAVALRAPGPRVVAVRVVDEMEPPPRARIAAVISLVAWLTALTLGRLVGYF